MPNISNAVTLKKMELRSKALAANSGDLPHLEVPRAQLDAMTAELKDLTAHQASLAAGKQEASKRLAELAQGARKLLTFLDTGVKQHYGNRAEKLVELGLQPFRSQPRVRQVGPDGKPVKRKPAETTTVPPDASPHP